MRAIEALCAPPECHILSGPGWHKLLHLVDPVLLFNKSFLDRALGQAVGAIVKKKKVNGCLVTREDISLTKFCDSFRYTLALVVDIISLQLWNNCCLYRTGFYHMCSVAMSNG